MKKILSRLLVMLFIFAMGGGVYAENGDVDSIEYLCAVQTMPRQYTSLSHHYDRPLTGTGDDERNSIPPPGTALPIQTKPTFTSSPPLKREGLPLPATTQHGNIPPALSHLSRRMRNQMSIYR